MLLKKKKQKLMTSVEKCKQTINMEWFYFVMKIYSFKKRLTRFKIAVNYDGTAECCHNFPCC